MIDKKKILSGKKTRAAKSRPGSLINLSKAIQRIRTGAAPKINITSEVSEIADKKNIAILQSKPPEKVLSPEEISILEKHHSAVKQNLEIDYFLPYQLAWINDPFQISIRDKSRRTGGTQTVAFEALLWAFETKMKDRDIWFTSADKKAAEEFIRACEMWARIFNLVSELISEPLIGPDDKEEDFYLKYEIRIPLGNNEFIRVNALASNVNAFHGKQGFMIVDELARHKDQLGVWEGALPATIWGYPLRVISTQNGKGLFFQLTEACKKGKHPNWGYHHTDIYEATKDGLLDKVLQGQGKLQPGEKATQEQIKEWIDTIHKDCLNESVWNQQFLCKAEDDNVAFIPYPLIYAVQMPNILLTQDIIPVKWDGQDSDHYIYGPDDPRSKWVHQALKNFEIWYLSQKFEESYIGTDIGRHKDLTVPWFAEKILGIKVTRFIFELYRVPFWVQKQLLIILTSHPSVRRHRIDKNGIGENLAEDLVYKFGSRVEAVVLSNTSKESMAYRFKAEFEDKTLRVPDDEVLAADIHMPKKETTDSGNTRFKVNKETDADGNEIGHADRFWAGALMVTGDDVNSGPLIVASAGRRQSSKMTRGYE
jgi:phage FluMu gp28-like protein